MYKVITILIFLIMTSAHSFCQIPDDQKTKENECLEVGNMLFDIPPEFPGGIDSLLSYLQSSITIDNDSIVNDKVIVQFWIDTTGYPIDAKIVRGINPKQNSEAIRITYSMPRWKPAMAINRKVRVKYSIPVVFKKME